MSDNRDYDEYDDLLNDMYAEDPNAAENLIKRQAAAAHARSYIKIRDKNTVENIDEKGNKILVPSEHHVKKLEEKLNDQIKITKAQSAQINFLNTKCANIERELKALRDNISAFINDSF